jgi:hypothetical protein
MDISKNQYRSTGGEAPFYSLLGLNRKIVMSYFMFLLLRPCRKPRGQKNKNNVVPSIFIKF